MRTIDLLRYYLVENSCSIDKISPRGQSAWGRLIANVHQNATKYEGSIWFFSKQGLYHRIDLFGNNLTIHVWSTISPKQGTPLACHLDEITLDLNKKESLFSLKRFIDREEAST